MESRQDAVAQRNKGWMWVFRGGLLIVVGMVGLLGLVGHLEEGKYLLSIMFAVLAPGAIVFGILLVCHGRKLARTPLPEELSRYRDEPFITPEIIDINDENPRPKT
jgi:hypothetical protein